MSEAENGKLLAHTTTEHLNGKLIHIQASHQPKASSLSVAVCFYFFFLSVRYLREHIEIPNLFCTKLASDENC